MFNYKSISTINTETFDDQQLLNEYFMIQMKDIQNDILLLL